MAVAAANANTSLFHLISAVFVCPDCSDWLSSANKITALSVVRYGQMHGQIRRSFSLNMSNLQALRQPSGLPSNPPFGNLKLDIDVL